MQGTNTDAVLIQTNSPTEDWIIAWHKTATSSDITSGIGTVIRGLLEKVLVDSKDIICVTIGTTVRISSSHKLYSLIDIAEHFINAILECDAEKLERVGVIRLASQFTRATPPFVDFEIKLRNCMAVDLKAKYQNTNRDSVIYGGHVIIDGGLQVDGSEIGPISWEQILQACEQFQHDNVQDVVVCGVYSPIADTVNQEKLCQEIIAESFDRIRVHCSSDGEDFATLSHPPTRLILLQLGGLVSCNGRMQLFSMLRSTLTRL